MSDPIKCDHVQVSVIYLRRQVWNIKKNKKTKLARLLRIYLLEKPLYCFIFLIPMLLLKCLFSASLSTFLSWDLIPFVSHGLSASEFVRSPVSIKYFIQDCFLDIWWKPCSCGLHQFIMLPLLVSCPIVTVNLKLLLSFSHKVSVEYFLLPVSES